MTSNTDVADSKVQEEPQPHIEQTAPEAPKPDVDHNWQAANEVLKLQKSKIEELESAITQLRQQPIKEEPDEFDSLDPEDYMTVGKAKQLALKTAEKIAERKAREIVHEYSQKNRIEQSEQRARERFEDYDYVVENFVTPMIKKNPAYASIIQNDPDPALRAYKLAISSDEYEGKGMVKSTSPKAEKVLKNASRPTTGAAVPNSLKTQADEFSKMSPSEIWNQSQKYARQG